MATKKPATNSSPTRSATFVIEEGFLVCRLPIASDPAPSKSGKTRIVYTTHGVAKPGLEIGGRPVSLNFNAYVPAE